MEKTGFIYIWYDRKRKMFYIGSHLGTEDDGYVCSSKRMRDNYKNRPEDFKRKILESNISRKDVIWSEKCWLWFVDPKQLGKKYYNMTRDPASAPKWHTAEERKKVVLAKRLETINGRTEEEKAKINLAVSKGKKKAFQERRDKGLPNFGVQAAENIKNGGVKKRGTKLSIEHKEKLKKKSKALWENEEYKKKNSEGLKKAWATGKFEKRDSSNNRPPSRKGKTNSKEQNDKIGLANSKKRRTEAEKANQSTKMKKYYASESLEKKEARRKARSEAVTLWWASRKELTYGC